LDLPTTLGKDVDPPQPGGDTLRIDGGGSQTPTDPRLPTGGERSEARNGRGSHIAVDSGAYGANQCRETRRPQGNETTDRG